MKTRAPVLVSSFDEWRERFARSATIAADGGYVSSATLPLLVDGVAGGVLAFHFTAPVNFDDDYRDLLASVARHCAQAVERARLYETADRARAEAETANRHKDELVSIVSHELRTPLNAILGWTSMLQQGMLDQQGAQRAVHSIADNASRQLRLVEDLLDFSRLQSGRMSLDLKEVDLRPLLRDVIESIIPVAASGGIQLDVSAVPEMHLTANPRRMEQVFLDLLANALKFTPEGGRVTVAVESRDAEVHVRITDTGPGIDPEFLPHTFEAFRQADAASRHYGGAGLGLSIAKELVDAHKGRIAAESPARSRSRSFNPRRGPTSRSSTRGSLPGNAAQPWAEAVSIRTNRIYAVGTSAAIKAAGAARVIDAGGRLLIPGINDAHAHPGAMPEVTRLEGPSAIEHDPPLDEVLARIRKAVDVSPAGRWTVGEIGANALDDPRATRATLDPLTPDRPLMLYAWTGHGAIFNTAALRALQVSDTEADPPGGWFGRADGRLTGLTHEYATYRLSQRLSMIPDRAAQVKAMQAFAARRRRSAAPACRR